MSTIPTEVVRRFAYKRNVSLSDAYQLFDQLETFLDKASTCKASPSTTIDEAWHEFVLHTKDYTDFCMRRYGRFIHHVPTSPLCCEGECGTGVISSVQIENHSRATHLADCDSDGRCSSDCSSPCDSN